MKVTATQQVEVEITDRELGHALHIRARQMYNCDFDDAGCGWLTDGAGNTYVSDATWHASSNPEFAAMIDAANILMYGQRMIVQPLVQESMFPAGEDAPLFTLPEDPDDQHLNCSKCNRHPAESGLARWSACDRCGAPVCDTCAWQINDGIYCGARCNYQHAD